VFAASGCRASHSVYAAAASVGVLVVAFTNLQSYYQKQFITVSDYPATHYQQYSRLGATDKHTYQKQSPDHEKNQGEAAREL